MGKLLCLIGLLLVTDFARSDDNHARIDEALRRKLFKDYNPVSLPNSKTTVNLTGITVASFDVIELENKMEIQTWVKMTWNDPRFQWSPDENDGITFLAVREDEVWTPHFVLYNPDTAEDTTLSTATPTLVYSTGRILQVPPYQYRFQCILDLTYWPNDVQNCSMKLGSWVYSALVLDINTEGFEFEFLKPDEVSPGSGNLTKGDFKITNWTYLREEKFYDCCSEPYVSVITSFVLTRDSASYNWTVKLPVICLCLLTAIQFLLPPAAGEKVTFGGICLILDFIFLAHITSEIGLVHNNTPLILQLLGQQIVLVMVCLMVSAKVIRTARAPRSTGLPPFLRESALGMAKFLCLGNYVDSKSSKDSDLENGSVKAPVYTKGGTSSDSSSVSASGEWVMLAATVDRLLLFLYVAICIVTFIRFHGVL